MGRSERGDRASVPPNPRRRLPAGAGPQVIGLWLESTRRARRQAASLAGELRPIATASGVAARGWSPEGSWLGQCKGTRREPKETRAPRLRQWGAVSAASELRP